MAHNMLEFNMKTHADKALFKSMSSGISGAMFSSYVTVHCS